MSTVLIIPVFTFIFVLSWGFIFGKTPVGNAYITSENIYGRFLSIKEINFDDYNNIYVKEKENPSLRYLLEYGVLKGKFKSYPKNFTFEKGNPPIHNPRKDIKHCPDEIVKGYDLVIE